ALVLPQREEPKRRCPWGRCWCRRQAASQPRRRRRIRGLEYWFSWRGLRTLFHPVGGFGRHASAGNLNRIPNSIAPPEGGAMLMRIPGQPASGWPVIPQVQPISHVRLEGVLLERPQQPAAQCRQEDQR